MKVYLLISRDNNSEDEIHGIYSTREKAIESFPFNSWELDNSNIEEFELDPTNGQERYETCFYATCFAKDSKWNHSGNGGKMLPNKLDELHFGDASRDQGLSCVAYARTIEEAQQKAAAGLLAKMSE